ncbi:hypothetical protein EK904_004951 [Melospiza melodia maxima]|nr:hypothetical protein EK904_004951 [Melospiza melodia maxima]
MQLKCGMESCLFPTAETGIVSWNADEVWGTDFVSVTNSFQNNTNLVVFLLPPLLAEHPSLDCSAKVFRDSSWSATLLPEPGPSAVWPPTTKHNCHVMVSRVSQGCHLNCMPMQLRVSVAKGNAVLLRKNDYGWIEQQIAALTPVLGADTLPMPLALHTHRLDLLHHSRPNLQLGLHSAKGTPNAPGWRLTEDNARETKLPLHQPNALPWGFRR